MSQTSNDHRQALAGLLSGSARPNIATQGLASLIQTVGLGQPHMAVGSSLLAPPTTKPLWIYVTRRFEMFQSNLTLTSNQIEDGITKFKGVVSCLNAAYWGHNSATENAFLIGSWAKNTCIRPPRDVDLYFVLPRAVYERFQSYSVGVNRQSALLQEIKGKLLGSYPGSSIKGDGPVVFAGFRSYSVEIVPAFLYDASERSYYVCDTKNGGRYIKTMPLHEVEAIEVADKRNNSNIRRLIRMLKCWQSYCSVPIKSFYLELLATEFLNQWKYSQEDYFYFDWICRDYFSWMLTKVNSYVFAPGTGEIMALGNAWQSRAESAYARATKACEYERENNMLSAGDEWQKIFGNDIPKVV